MKTGRSSRSRTRQLHNNNNNSLDIYIAHIAEASRRLETEGGVEMT